MRISLNSFNNQAISLFKESILPALTAQQKKIFIVASIAIGFLAALYVAKRYCFQASKSNKPEKITDDFGNVYEGTFKDTLNGKGKITYADGFVYEGTLKDGKFNGKSKVSYKDKGPVLEIEIKNGTVNGKGKITLKNGTVFIGEFKDCVLINTSKSTSRSYAT